MNGINFPDPSMIRVNPNLFYAFSTNAQINGQTVHIPMASSTNFVNWTHLGTKDALPNLPTWIDNTNPRIWAPDVVQIANGQYVMYYTAATKANTNLHCLGVATSSTVDGPYRPTSNSPWICPTSQGGAIDPAGYAQQDGTRWVVYKVDGNAIGHGGTCGNTVAPIVSTPIMLQQVSPKDGYSLMGSPTQLITNSIADGPVTEAPSLSQMPDGTFVLFFSSNCFATTLYDVAYATSKNIAGPYTKGGPMFLTQNIPGGLVAPGGLDIAVNGNHAVFHANYGTGRAMYTATISGGGSQWNAYSTDPNNPGKISL